MSNSEKTSKVQMSGNFETEDAEVKYVTDWLLQEVALNEKESFLPGRDFTVRKYAVADDADVVVEFRNGRKFTVEVKEEEDWRFSKWGEYGLDYLSCFRFKNGIAQQERLKWRRPTDPSQLRRFENQIEVKKPGKMLYSKANIWLFVVRNKNNQYKLLRGYSLKKMKKAGFFDEVKRTCKFCVNAKPATQMSHSDNFESACFFVNPKMMADFIVEGNEIVDFVRWKERRNQYGQQNLSRGLHQVHEDT